MLLDMKTPDTWVSLGDLTKRTAARLRAIREGKIFAGDAERPADEWGAATGRYAPAAASGRREAAADQGGDGSAGRVRTGDLLVMSQASYRCSTARKIHIAGSIEARTAETAEGPTPSHAVSVAPSC